MPTKKLSSRDSHDFLFELRVNLGHYGKPAKLAIIRAFEDNARPYGPSHTALRLELQFEGKLVFSAGRIGIPGHESIDGKSAMEGALSLFAMKPGDTDDEFFADYTEAQLDFVQSYGEEIGMIREQRFCDENGNVK